MGSIPWEERLMASSFHSWRRPRAWATTSGETGARSCCSKGSSARSKSHDLGEPVEGVPVGLQAQPVPEPDRPLGRPGGMGQDQVLAPTRLAGGQGGGEGLAVPRLGDGGPAQLEHGGHDVDLVVEAVLDRQGGGVEARPAQDHGQSGGELVGGLVVAVDAQLAEVLTVVGGDHHRRVVPQSEGVELVDDLAHVVVGVAHPGVVAVVHPGHVVHRRGLLGLAGPLVPYRAGTEPGDLLGRVGPGLFPVGRPDLLGQPVGDPAVTEGVPERQSACGRGCGGPRGGRGGTSPGVVRCGPTSPGPRPRPARPSPSPGSPG